MGRKSINFKDRRDTFTEICMIELRCVGAACGGCALRAHHHPESERGIAYASDQAMNSTIFRDFFKLPKFSAYFPRSFAKLNSCSGMLIGTNTTAAQQLLFPVVFLWGVFDYYYYCNTPLLTWLHRWLLLTL